MYRIEAFRVLYKKTHHSHSIRKGKWLVSVLVHSRQHIVYSTSKLRRVGERCLENALQDTKFYVELRYNAQRAIVKLLRKIDEFYFWLMCSLFPDKAFS